MGRNGYFTMRSDASAQYQDGEQSNPFDGEAMEMDHNQPAENAKCYHYDAANKSWNTSMKRVRVNRKPCGEGGMRLVVRLDILKDSDLAVEQQCVAKIFKSDKAHAKEYLNEAITQVSCQLWADQFNSLPVPNRVSFLPVTVMELVDRPQKDLVNVEPLMQGNFFKHNDNAGRVKSDRHTPQAFSHFSWEASNHTLLICDIQGVSTSKGDLFTDPQIHSIDGIENGNTEDGTGYGPGNFGHQGIMKFIETHKCNKLCQQLGLPELRQDADLNQPSRWSTQCVECNIPRTKGTTSRLSPTRINTAEIDKYREGQVDYPDLQAPHPPPLPQQQQQAQPQQQQQAPQHTEATRRTAQIKLQQQEMLWQMHSEAPHLLSAQEAKNPQWISQAREFRDRRPARKASWQEEKVARYPRMEQVQEELLTSPRSYGVSPRGESYEDMILRRLRSADIGGGENHMPRSPRAVQSPKTVMSNIPRMPAGQSPRARYAAPMSPSSRSTPLHYADCATESSRYAPPRSPLNMLNSHLPSSYNSVRPAMGMHGAGGAPWFRGAPMHHQGPMYM